MTSSYLLPPPLPPPTPTTTTTTTTANHQAGNAVDFNDRAFHCADDMVLMASLAASALVAVVIGNFYGSMSLALLVYSVLLVGGAAVYWGARGESPIRTPHWSTNRRRRLNCRETSPGTCPK